MHTTTRLTVAALGAATLALGSTAPRLTAQSSSGASASAASGFWAWTNNATDAGWNYWKFSKPTDQDQITWTSGPNRADGTAYAQQTFGPEPKFYYDPGPPSILTGRNYKGFSLSQPGDCTTPSKAITSGQGSSEGVTGFFGGLNWDADWTVNATGKTGSGPCPVTFWDNPSWTSQAAGKDPFTVTPAKLADAGIVGPTYSVFFEAALTGGRFSPLGGIGLHVGYEDASGTLDLLDIALDAAGAHVSGDDVPGLRIYRLGSMAEGPTTNPAHLVTRADIASSLGADVARDHALDVPEYWGFVLEDLRFPTADLGDGSVAHIDVDAEAYDAGAGPSVVPEPAAMSLVASGLLCLVGVRRARRRPRCR